MVLLETNCFFNPKTFYWFQRVGMMDVELRMYKMIEVMVLYVHILKNVYENVTKDFDSAK